jgi:DNA-binding CsgD family transcriptional regulator
MKNYYLYGIYCPLTNELKYVGITTQTLQKRLNNHLKKPTNYNISKWFDTLLFNNLIPEIKLIKECNTYEELLISEINEIKKQRENNVKLFNILDGGDINPMFGRTHTKEAKEKISKTHKGKKLTIEQSLKHKEIIVNLWNDINWVNKLKKVDRKGSNNPNWKGDYNSCKCGKQITKKNKTCRECYDISGHKNPFFNKKHNINTLKKISKDRNYNGINNPNFKYDIDINQLKELYIINNKTIDEIKNIYGCSRNTIRKILQLNKIIKEKSNKYNLKKHEIIKYLNDGLNYVEIGKIYNCSNKIIHKYIKNNIKNVN